MASPASNAAMPFFVRTLLICLTATIVGARASAASLAPTSGALQVGAGDRTRTATIIVGWSLPWQAVHESGELSLSLEASFGRWWINEDGRARSPWVSQVGLTPVVRWSFGAGGRPWFSELGIGVNVLTPVFHDKDRDFSTAFNFGDHVAVGRRLGTGSEVAVRLQHFSNGGIRQPNPGINFVQLRWTRRF